MEGDFENGDQIDDEMEMDIDIEMDMDLDPCSSPDLSGQVDSGQQSEEMTDDEEKPEQVRKMSDALQIFYINISRVDEAHKKNRDEHGGSSSIRRLNNLQRINFMVCQYNLPRQNRPIYEKVKKYGGTFTRKEPFSLIVYSKQEVFIDEETGQKFTGLSKIRFLYREKPVENSEAESPSTTEPQIFALASENGRWLVLKWAESEFPLSIASLILEEKSVDRKTLKSLFENRFLSKFFMKKGEDLHQSSGVSLRFCPKIYTNFRARVKSKSEIAEILKPRSNFLLKMNVMANSISFSYSIKSMDIYVQLCELLSDLHMNEDLPRSKDFSSYLVKCHKEDKDRLELALRREIDWIVNPFEKVWEHFSESKLKDFLICPKNSEDYFSAAKYGISRHPYHSTPFHTFNESILLNFLVEAYRKQDETRPKYSFSAYLENVKIGYEENGEWTAACKFLSCLEGIYYDVETEADFWRVGGEWYGVSDYYSFDVHMQFIQCLKDNLIEPGNSSLEIPWRYKPLPTSISGELKTWKEEPLEREARYNQKYADRPNFILADDKLVYNSIEFCDLLEFFPGDADANSSKIYLYHVKKYFKAESMRVLVGQVIDSASMLQTALARDHETSFLRKIHRWATETEKKPNFIKQHFPTFESFKMGMKNATFVCAIAHKDQTRSLRQEQNLKDTFDFAHFHEEIHRQIDKLPQRLKQYFDTKYDGPKLNKWLAECSFIDQENKFTSDWFSACDKKNGKFQKEATEKWNSCPWWPHKTGIPKLGPILKEKYYTNFESVPAKQQILLAAEAVTTMGFNFKICEIMPEKNNEYFAILNGESKVKNKVDAQNKLLLHV